MVGHPTAENWPDVRKYPSWAQFDPAAQGKPVQGSRLVAHFQKKASVG